VDEWPVIGVPNSIVVQKPYAPAEVLTAISFCERKRTLAARASVRLHSLQTFAVLLPDLCVARGRERHRKRHCCSPAAPTILVSRGGVQRFEITHHVIDPSREFRSKVLRVDNVPRLPE
jgi:hypothetical protein